MNINFDEMTRFFILTEGSVNPNILSYVQALEETLNVFKPSTLREKRNLEVASAHLREIRRHAKKMSEDIRVLEERLQILEESKTEK
jgi:hypothetical protein